jgi:hypothetical protein
MKNDIIAVIIAVLLVVYGLTNSEPDNAQAATGTHPEAQQ